MTGSGREALDPQALPPNEVAPHLLARVLEYGDDMGDLANAKADDLRDALRLAAAALIEARSELAHREESVDRLIVAARELEAERDAARTEAAEWRALVRLVDRWIEESDAERNADADGLRAPLESAERQVTIARHLIGQKYPHLSRAALSTGEDEG